jgi:hypothetical protein
MSELFISAQPVEPQPQRSASEDESVWICPSSVAGKGSYQKIALHDNRPSQPRAGNQLDHHRGGFPLFRAYPVFPVGSGVAVIQENRRYAQGVREYLSSR